MVIAVELGVAILDDEIEGTMLVVKSEDDAIWEDSIDKTVLSVKLEDEGTGVDRDI